MSALVDDRSVAFADQLKEVGDLLAGLSVLLHLPRLEGGQVCRDAGTKSVNLRPDAYETTGHFGAYLADFRAHVSQQFEDEALSFGAHG